MIPKIIHNIWLQGYDNLSNTIKIQHNKIKKLNPEWEFTVWDNNMIEKLLKKYPKIYDKYRNAANYSRNTNATKSYIARYIIMKEYGGVYCDIEDDCDNNSFNSLFRIDDTEIQQNHETHQNTNKTLYVASEKNNVLSYIAWFNESNYSSSFMAMDKQHPIWEKVIVKLIFSTSEEQIETAFNISLREIEASPNSYPIITVDKVNGYYQSKNSNTQCYTKDDFSSNPFRSILKYINCHYKQILLIVLVIIIIAGVEKLYFFNVSRFGTINFIPGMPPPNIVQPPKSVLSASSKNKTRKTKPVKK